LIFLQIGGNQPLWAGPNPTKSGVNWPIFVTSRKDDRDKTIFAKNSKNTNNAD
jgi:hypothetical protein